MNIEELERHKEKEPSEIHRHPNGGGWVENTAKVDETAFVGKNAGVFDHAQVLENARICDEATISGHAVVSQSAAIEGEATVFGNAEVGRQAVISGSAQIFGQAKVLGNTRVDQQAKIAGSAKIDGWSPWISGDAWIKGNAEIKGNTYVNGSEWNHSPLRYKGTCLCISHSKEGYAAIHDMADYPSEFWAHPHEFWIGKEGEKFLKEAGLGDSDISECHQFVRKIIKAEQKSRIIADARQSILNVIQKVTQKFGMRMG